MRYFNLIILGAVSLCMLPVINAHAEDVLAAPAGAKLTNVKRAMILFSGEDSSRTKVMEDAMALRLMEAGITVASRTQVEGLIAQKVNEAIESEQAANADSAEKGKKSDAKRKNEPVGAIQVAKAAGVQIVLLGTILEDRLPVTEPSEQVPQPTMGPIVVTVASMQVIDVQTDTILLAVTGNWTKGENIVNAASQMIDPLKKAIRR